jgi:hypothetical protein
MPMNNVMNLVNQYEAPNVINFNNMQNNVSPFYSSANNLQFFASPSHMPMDSAACYGTTSYLANCSEPSHITPYVTNFSAPYASSDNLNSATHLHNSYSRISENSVGPHVPSSNIVACDTPPKHLQNFGNTDVSLLKNIERSEGQSSKKWAEDLAKEVLEAIAMGANQRKKVYSISTSNLAKAGLNNTCAESNQQEENIAEPSSVEKEHQNEDAQDLEKKEDNKLENHQEAEQDIVQVVQPSYSLNMINFDNNKIIIRSDQTGFARGKNVVLDDSAPPRMIKPKNIEVQVWKVKGKNNQVPKPKPTVSMLLKKYTSRKADNVCNRLGNNKRPRSPSRHGG